MLNTLVNRFILLMGSLWAILMRTVVAAYELKGAPLYSFFESNPK